MCQQSVVVEPADHVPAIRRLFAAILTTISNVGEEGVPPEVFLSASMQVGFSANAVQLLMESLVEKGMLSLASANYTITGKGRVFLLQLKALESDGGRVARTLH